MNFHDNSKNKNQKNPKNDFTIVSAHCSSLMKVGSKLRGERMGGADMGSAYAQLGQSLIIYN